MNELKILLFIIKQIMTINKVYNKISHFLIGLKIQKSIEPQKYKN